MPQDMYRGNRKQRTSVLDETLHAEAGEERIEGAFGHSPSGDVEMFKKTLMGGGWLVQGGGVLASQHLFVYGSLRAGGGSLGNRRLAGRAVLVERGTLRGRLYRVSWFPAAVDSLDESERVVGEIFRLVDLRLLESLDLYEECADGLFERVVRPVLLASGRTLEAWVYLYGREVDERDRIESGDYLQMI